MTYFQEILDKNAKHIQAELYKAVPVLLGNKFSLLLVKQRT